LQNQGKGLVFIKEESPLPTLIRCGVHAKLSKNLTLSADALFPKHGKRSICAGATISFRGLSFRAGYKETSDLEKDFCFGAGVQSKVWALDVALSPTTGLGNTYYVSFSLFLK
jgi:hypothetical protein